jgi:hypothetical protein
MSNYTYTEEMVQRMHDVCDSGVTEEIVQELCEEFEFPRRSVTAKLRKLGFDVPKKQGDAPKFSKEETEALVAYLEEVNGTKTADEIAADFMDGNFSGRQINGKALSLEMTAYIKPTEKKVAPKSYTDEEEATVVKMAEDGAFIEDIAAAVGKEVASVRGKLLSLGLKAPQKTKKSAKADKYAGVEDMLDKTVAEIAEHFDATERGVKTMLTRRGMACADYTPKTKSSDD